MFSRAFKTSYPYTPKSRSILETAISQLSLQTNPDRQFWQLVIRDTEKLCQTQRVNFAAFIFSVLDYSALTGIQELFQRFCVRGIGNNWHWLQHEVVRDYEERVTALEIMIGYLINRTVDGYVRDPNPPVQQSIFNILSFILNKKDLILNEGQLMHVSRALNFRRSITSKTIDVVDLVLGSLGEKLGRKGLGRMFQGLVRTFHGRDGPDYHYFYYKNYEVHEKEYYNNLKEQIGKIFHLLDQKHPHLIKLLQPQLSNLLKKDSNLSLISHLLTLPHFKKIIFSESFIFETFRRCRRDICELLWSYEEERERICAMRVKEEGKGEEQGKGILEMVAEGYGLTHRFVEMIWEAGGTGVFPRVRNRKSRAILRRKYGELMKQNNQD